ncbi:MAG: ABC transporter permease [Pseudomonadota bacterium]
MAVPGEIRTIFQVLAALMVREMTTRYARLSGGYLWAVVEPVAVICLLSILFSQAFRTPPLGTSFVLFYATGYLPLILFSDVADKTAAAVSFSRQLLAYPRVTVLDAVLARFLLNLLTQILVFTLVLSGLALAGLLPHMPRMDILATAVALAAALALGVGLLNCLAFSQSPMWQRLWSIVSRPLFLISGLFYTFEGLPAHIRELLIWNPLIHVVGLVRAALYPTYYAAYVQPGYVLALGLATAVLGALMLRVFDAKEALR